VISGAESLMYEHGVFDKLSSPVGISQGLISDSRMKDGVAWSVYQTHAFNKPEDAEAILTSDGVKLKLSSQTEAKYQVGEMLRKDRIDKGADLSQDTDRAQMEAIDNQYAKLPGVEISGWVATGSADKKDIAVARFEKDAYARGKDASLMATVAKGDFISPARIANTEFGIKKSGDAMELKESIVSGKQGIGAEFSTTDLKLTGLAGSALQLQGQQEYVFDGKNISENNASGFRFTIPNATTFETPVSFTHADTTGRISGLRLTQTTAANTAITFQPKNDGAFGIDLAKVKAVKDSVFAVTKGMTSEGKEVFRIATILNINDTFSSKDGVFQISEIDSKLDNDLGLWVNNKENSSALARNAWAFDKGRGGYLPTTGKDFTIFAGKNDILSDNKQITPSKMNQAAERLEVLAKTDATFIAKQITDKNGKDIKGEKVKLPVPEAFLAVVGNAGFDKYQGAGRELYVREGTKLGSLTNSQKLAFEYATDAAFDAGAYKFEKNVSAAERTSSLNTYAQSKGLADVKIKDTVTLSPQGLGQLSQNTFVTLPKNTSINLEYKKKVSSGTYDLVRPVVVENLDKAELTFKVGENTPEYYSHGNHNYYNTIHALTENGIYQYHGEGLASHIIKAKEEKNFSKETLRGILNKLGFKIQDEKAFNALFEKSQSFDGSKKQMIEELGKGLVESSGMKVPKRIDIDLVIKGEQNQLQQTIKYGDESVSMPEFINATKDRLTALLDVKNGNKGWDINADQWIPWFSAPYPLKTFEDGKETTKVSGAASESKTQRQGAFEVRALSEDAKQLAAFKSEDIRVSATNPSTDLFNGLAYTIGQGGATFGPGSGELRKWDDGKIVFSVDGKERWETGHFSSVVGEVSFVSGDILTGRNEKLGVYAGPGVRYAAEVKVGADGKNQQMYAIENASSLEPGKDFRVSDLYLSIPEAYKNAGEYKFDVTGAKARPEGFVASFRNPDPGANKLPEFIGISSPGKSGSGTTVKKDLTAQHEWALNRPVSSSALEFEPKGTIKLSNGTEYNIGEVRIEKTSLMVPARSETAYPANNTYEVPTYVHVAAGPGDAWKKAFAVEQNHLQNLAPGSPVLYEGMPLVLSKSEGSISGIFRGDYFNNGSCSFVSDGTGFIDVTASSTGIGLYKYIGEDTALGAYAAGKLNVSNKAYQFLGVKGQARVLDAPMAKLIDKAYPSLASQAKTSLKDGAQEYAAYVLSPQADMLQVNGDYLVPENAVGKLSVASKISQASVDDFRQASGLSGDITQDMQKDGKFYKVSLATTDFHPQDTLSQSFFMAKVDSDKKEGIINRSSISGRDTGVFFADKKLQNEIDKPAGAGSNANGAGASEMKSKKLATRADVLSLDQNTALFTGGSLRLNFPLNGGCFC
jgi:hypothetical protein